MKIDKGNPVHWLLLAAFFCCVLVAYAIRGFTRNAGRHRAIFYGHKLAGNLAPVYRALRSLHGDRWGACFLTMDRAYARELRSKGECAVFAVSWEAVRWMATAEVVVSDHGLHAMTPLLRARGLRFFDVWHGIPFKGFDGDDFQVQHRYAATWVASPLLERMYVERFGFKPERVHVTGYARTDQLVRQDMDVARIRQDFGLPATGRIILFAPTWKQDARNRSLYPFGEQEPEFLRFLSAMATRHEASVVVRAHLNSKQARAAPPPAVFFRPFDAYPETERLLFATDLLICDWSSIAFDYLLLDRPAIFLGVEPPFRKGFSLDPAFRYGPVAGDLADLDGWVDVFMGDPDAWESRFSANALSTRNRIYGEFADGNSTARCIAHLLAPPFRP
jgi:CDP-glycerol glycerophosphotransferase